MRYYSLYDGLGLARVHGGSYEYLDKVGGCWVRHARLFNTVEFEASTEEISADDARRWITANTRFAGYPLTSASS